MELTKGPVKGQLADVKAKNAKRRQKQRWPFIRQRTYPSGKVGWLVDARTGKGGEKRVFETVTEAETWAEQQRIRRSNEGLQAFQNEDLAKYGKTVQDAVSFYLAFLRSHEGSQSVKDTIAAFIAYNTTTEPKSARYLADLRNRLKRFEASFGEEKIASLTADMLNEWLNDRSVSIATRNTMRRRLSALFSFAKSQKWRPDNPFAGGKKADVRAIREPKRGRKATLTNEQVATLLEVASDENLPFWAIAIFAGLRPQSELFRLDWKNVDLDEMVIDVPHDAKTGARSVDISSNLAQWLLPYARKTGRIAPAGDAWRKLRDEKRLAGFGTPGTETDAEKQKGIKLVEWVEDMTRHTYGSNHLATNKDIGITSTQMGTDPGTVKRHYINVVKPKDAAAFWEIQPAASKVVSIAAA
jgi:integrase